MAKTGPKPKSIEARFREKFVEGRADKCWGWLAGTAGAGYGALRIGGWGDNRKEYAHRLAWKFKHGDIPEGLSVCHKCDNPRCVNPEHLFLATHKENHIDSCQKGRRANGERQGSSKLKEEDVAEIRRRYRRYSKGINSAVALAKRFGVSVDHISRIARREQWHHI